METLRRVLDDGFVPFAFGAQANLRALCPRPLGVDLLEIEALRPSGLAFHHALHRLNQQAFGGPGMGMPAWVQLDCCVLPAAFVGLARPAAHLPVAQRQLLDPDARDADLLPVAEAMAVPTAVPGTWMSFSLATVLPGQGLALVSKALGLAAWGVRRSLGVAQYGHRSLRTHSRFGALRLVEPQVAYHSQPRRTFVYAIEDAPDGVRRALGDAGPAEEPSWWLDPEDVTAIATLAERVRAGTHAAWILPPGIVLEERGPRCPIREVALP